MKRLPDASFLHRLADAADRETVLRFRTSLEAQSKPKEGVRYDPVTDADRETERAIRALIEQEYPEHAIQGEEYGSTGSGPVRWVIDPIDGTRPYLLGIPVWGTLVGVTDECRAVRGIMSQPITGERFWADQDGAWTRRAGIDTPLRTSSKTQLSDAVLHMTSPEGIERNPDVAFAALTERVKMTRYGGECYAFAMLAAGHIDLCFELSVQPYDIVALIPLIERAGGVVTTLEGARAEGGGRVLASANSVIHAAAISVLSGRAVG